MTKTVYCQKFKRIRIFISMYILTGISKIWRHKKVKILIQKVFYPTVRINLKPKQYNKACQNFYDWARANTKYLVTILPFTKWSLKVFFQIAFKVVHSKYVCRLGWAPWNLSCLEFKFDDTRLSYWHKNKIGRIEFFFVASWLC